MVEETVSGTGVTGNTPAATQAAAQQSASAARNALKKDWQTKGKNYVIALTIALLLIALSRLYDWSFFWLITVGTLLYFAASRVSDPVAKGPYKDLLPWVHFGKILGVILVVGSVLSSSFVAYLAMTVNDVEKAVDNNLKSHQPGYVRMVSDTIVNIPQGGFDRFVGSGEVNIRNTGQGQCLTIEPEEKFFEKTSGSSVEVHRQSDNQLLYRLSWTNGRVTQAIFERPTLISVVTTPVGKKTSGGNVCSYAW